MTTRKALGKGLGALIPNAEGSAAGRDQRFVPIDRIIPNRRQPRMGFDEKAISGLAESIREQGVLEPLILRPISSPGADFELVAGERRWRAAQKVGLDKVPAIIRELSDREALELALTENIQREELNAIEEAHGYRMLNDEFGMTQDDISKRVGVERSTVANMLRLLKLDEPIQMDIAKGALSPGHARALLALEGEIREWLWREIVKKGLTVRQAELISQKPRFKAGTAGEKSRAAAIDAALEEMETRLSQVLGTKVKIRMGRRGGAIEIRFANRNEMEGIFDRILGE